MTDVRPTDPAPSEPSVAPCAEPSLGAPLAVDVNCTPEQALHADPKAGAAKLDPVPQVPAADLAEILPGHRAPADSPKLPPPVLRTISPIHFKLKNARQSEPFDDFITWTPDAAPLLLLWVGLPPGLGLTVSTETRRVQGRPGQCGDFTFPVQFRFYDDPVEAVRDGKITLFVNADPKSLWKSIPSDATAPMWKPDEARQMLHTSDRLLVAARQRGRSHAHVGSCCDDDFFIHHQLAEDWYVVVVADGAGSASASRRGSYVATRAAGHRLKALLDGPAGAEVIAAAAALAEQGGTNTEAWHVRMQRSLCQVLGSAAQAAMLALQDEVTQLPSLVRTVKDLSTTLMIGLARKVGTQWLCAAYWVGDGAVGVYSRGNFVHLLGEVDSGEYSGQTRFLDVSEVSVESLRKRTRYCLVDNFTAFILMTDGVSDAKFATEAQLSQVQAWDVLWDDLLSGARLDARDAEVDARLLMWLDFWSHGNHDDRTIALLY